MMYWWYFDRVFVVVCNIKPKFIGYVHICTVRAKMYKYTDEFVV